MGLKKVNKKIHDIVKADGDLTQKIEVKSQDEIGEITLNINSLLDYIRTVITNISENSNVLNHQKSRFFPVHFLSIACLTSHAHFSQIPISFEPLKIL